MVDIDTVLTPDEEARLNESLRDFKEGKATSLKDFEQEITEFNMLSSTKRIQFS